MSDGRSKHCSKPEESCYEVHRPLRPEPTVKTKMACTGSEYMRANTGRHKCHPMKDYFFEGQMLIIKFIVCNNRQISIYTAAWLKVHIATWISKH